VHGYVDGAARTRIINPYRLPQPAFADNTAPSARHISPARPATVCLQHSLEYHIIKNHCSAFANSFCKVCGPTGRNGERELARSIRFYARLQRWVASGTIEAVGFDREAKQGRAPISCPASCLKSLALSSAPRMWAIGLIQSGVAAFSSWIFN